LTQPELKKRPEIPVSDTPVKISNANFAWNEGDEPILKDIDLKVKQGELVMVVGSVGSGKSTILQAVLGEVSSVTKGKGKSDPSVELAGSVAYVAQEAWIVNATVRDNIIFGKPYDEKLYKEVVESSALLPDFAIMAAGDQTEIGDKGINLSGGQRQRVSIARVRTLSYFDILNVNIFEITLNSWQNKNSKCLSSLYLMIILWGFFFQKKRLYTKTAMCI